MEKRIARKLTKGEHQGHGPGEPKSTSRKEGQRVSSEIEKNDVESGSEERKMEQEGRYLRRWEMIQQNVGRKNFSSKLKEDTT